MISNCCPSFILQAFDLADTRVLETLALHATDNEAVHKIMQSFSESYFGVAC